MQKKNLWKRGLSALLVFLVLLLLVGIFTFMMRNMVLIIGFAMMYLGFSFFKMRKKRNTKALSLWMFLGGFLASATGLYMFFI